MVLIDLGEAFLSKSPPPKGDWTPNEYASPELLLKDQASTWADFWSLGCTMFEKRSGFPLLESWQGYDSHVLEEMIRVLGRPSDSWWFAFDERGTAVTEKVGESRPGFFIGAEPPMRGKTPSRIGWNHPLPDHLPKRYAALRVYSKGL